MNQVLIIVGPTAVGKTQLALTIAGELQAEIISADSRQIYRGMDIGTAKPTPEECRTVPHHFIDIKNPDEDYSAGAFGNDARALIRQMFADDRTPVVAGGAGFYIRALVDGLQSPPAGDTEIKQRLKARVIAEGLPVLREELARIDPVAAERIHPNDQQRTLRALEFFELTGKPFSNFQDQAPEPADFEPVMIGLTRDRKELYEIIDARVEKMLADGLLDEVRQLLGQGYAPTLNALQTVGYLEAIRHLQGKITHSEMTELIKKNTRNYAKRQLTWFRSDPRIHWRILEPETKIELLAAGIVEDFKFLRTNRRDISNKHVVKPD